MADDTPMTGYTLVERVDEGLLRRLGGWLHDADPGIAPDVLLPAADGWPDTLMPRIEHVTDHVARAVGLHDGGTGWLDVVARVVDGLPEDAQTDLGFDVWPLIMLLGRGLETPAASLAVLRDLGAKAYAEKGVRPFLLADLPGTLHTLTGWLDDPRPGVRRLAVESCRPRLPWAPVLRPLVDDPTPTIPLLEALRDDPDHLTRNAVANHLGDITRTHPDLVTDLLARWLAQPTAAREWIADHALRSLTRKGDAGALAVLGRGPVEATAALALSPGQVAIGEAFAMTVQVTSHEAVDREVRVEAAVHFLRASGGTTRKVFRWWTGTLAAGGTWEGQRTQPVRDLSTRTHQPGPHAVDLLLNGLPVATATVVLSPAGRPGRSAG